MDKERNKKKNLGGEGGLVLCFAFLKDKKEKEKQTKASFACRSDLCVSSPNNSNESSSSSFHPFIIPSTSWQSSTTSLPCQNKKASDQTVKKKKSLPLPRASPTPETGPTSLFRGVNTFSFQEWSVVRCAWA